jgi:hypothetical protein
MPSKILLKNAQISLEDHKCETCKDLVAMFRQYKIASNIECQQGWCSVEWAIALHGRYKSALFFVLILQQNYKYAEHNYFI